MVRGFPGAGIVKLDWGRGLGVVAGSSRSLLEDQDAQGRQEQDERLRLPVPADRRWGERPHVAPALAAVNHGVAIEDLLPAPAAPGNSYAKAPKDLTTEVAYD